MLQTEARKASKNSLKTCKQKLEEIQTEAGKASNRIWKSLQKLGKFQPEARKASSRSLENFKQKLGKLQTDSWNASNRSWKSFDKNLKMLQKEAGITLNKNRKSFKWEILNRS